VIPSTVEITLSRLYLALSSNIDRYIDHDTATTSSSGVSTIE